MRLVALALASLLLLPLAQGVVVPQLPDVGANDLVLRFSGPTFPVVGEPATFLGQYKVIASVRFGDVTLLDDVTFQGARITLMKDGAPAAETFTDAEGRFSFTVVLDTVGAYVLHARTDEGVESRKRTVHAVSVPSTPDVQATPRGAPWDEVTWSWTASDGGRPIVEVALALYDAAGALVPHAVLAPGVLAAPAPGDHVLEVRVRNAVGWSEPGTVSFTLLEPPAASGLAQESHRTFICARSCGWPIDDGQVGIVSMRDGGSIEYYTRVSGTLGGADGPLAGQAVHGRHAWSMEGAGTASVKSRLVTDAEGRFDTLTSKVRLNGPAVGACGWVATAMELSYPGARHLHEGGFWICRDGPNATAMEFRVVG